MIRLPSPLTASARMPPECPLNAPSTRIKFTSMVKSVLGPVSRSVFAIAGPEAIPGGTADRPTYNSGMRACRPHRQEPPQARLSSNGTSIQALRRQLRGLEHDEQDPEAGRGEPQGRQQAA